MAEPQMEETTFLDLAYYFRTTAYRFFGKLNASVSCEVVSHMGGSTVVD